MSDYIVKPIPPLRQGTKPLAEIDDGPIHIADIIRIGETRLVVDWTGITAFSLNASPREKPVENETAFGQVRRVRES